MIREGAAGSDGEDLDEQLDEALREFDEIKRHYDAQNQDAWRKTETIPSLDLKRTTVRDQVESGKEKMRVAERVLQKLYKRNKELEAKLRLQQQEITRLVGSQGNSSCENCKAILREKNHLESSYQEQLGAIEVLKKDREYYLRQSQQLRGDLEDLAKKYGELVSKKIKPSGKKAVDLLQELLQKQGNDYRIERELLCDKISKLEQENCDIYVENRLLQDRLQGQT